MAVNLPNKWAYSTSHSRIVSRNLLSQRRKRRLGLSMMMTKKEPVNKPSQHLKNWRGLVSIFECNFRFCFIQFLFKNEELLKVSHHFEVDFQICISVRKIVFYPDTENAIKAGEGEADGEEGIGGEGEQELELTDEEESIRANLADGEALPNETLDKILPAWWNEEPFR